jgi:hypothetical protein
MSDENRRALGDTGLAIPPIVFRADILDDAARVMPEQTRRLICGEWFTRVKPPVFIHARYRAGENSYIPALARMLTYLDVAPDDVAILLELEMSADSQDQLESARKQLGGQYVPRLLAITTALNDTNVTKWEGEAPAEPRVRSQTAQQELRPPTGPPHDFVVFSRGPTIMRHPLNELRRLAELAQRHIPIISTGVLNGGFLTGGHHVDGRPIITNNAADKSLMIWRKAFTSLCHGHGVRPAHACIQFALSAPGIAAVSMSTSNIDRVAANVEAAITPVPSALWSSMKEEGLLAEDYPHVA